MLDRSLGFQTSDGVRCRLRTYRLDDVDALARAADDPSVSRWLLAGFPHPYTREDAERWIAATLRESPARNFVIEAAGAFAGGCGYTPLDGSRSGVAIFGYWVAAQYRDRGIATAVARELSEHILGLGFRRLEAGIFAPNAASARVLEKCGFTLEARLREALVERDGTPCDELLYVRLRESPAGA